MALWIWNMNNPYLNEPIIDRKVYLIHKLNSNRYLYKLCSDQYLKIYTFVTEQLGCLVVRFPNQITADVVKQIGTLSKQYIAYTKLNKSHVDKLVTLSNKISLLEIRIVADNEQLRQIKMWNRFTPQ